MQEACHGHWWDRYATSNYMKTVCMRLKENCYKVHTARRDKDLMGGGVADKADRDGNSFIEMT